MAGFVNFTLSTDHTASFMVSRDIPVAVMRSERDDTVRIFYAGEEYTLRPGYTLDEVQDQIVRMAK